MGFFLPIFRSWDKVKEGTGSDPRGELFMNRPADRMRQPRAIPETKAPPAPPPKAPEPPSPPGTDAVALAELKNSAVTYDFLRKRGDPTQFWEVLRLARSKRAIAAPAE